ncbi:hypothetical protein KC887_03475 [Candidatus Kaiserbacteria bacterium]|nr:hypothetical protein [Candidatus Kaiserbacteria bacterium]
MPNSFYNYDGSLLPGTLAKAEDVGYQYQSVAAGFELLEAQLARTIRFTPLFTGNAEIPDSLDYTDKLIYLNANGDLDLLDANFGLDVRNQAAPYTLVIADTGNLLRVTGGTVTVPNNATAPFKPGAIIYVLQVGTTKITLSPMAGVTLNTPSSLSTAGNFALIKLTNVGTDEWDISGDLEHFQSIITEGSSPRVLTASDIGKLIRITGASTENIVYIPTDTNADIPIGAEIDLQQEGVGGCTRITAQNGVTIECAKNLEIWSEASQSLWLLRQNESVRLMKVGADKWLARSETQETVRVSTITGTTDYQVRHFDAGSLLRIDNANPVTARIEPYGLLPVPIGTVIHLRQIGAGQITVVPNTSNGVTVNTSDTLKTRAIGSTISLIKIDTNEWDLVGDMEAV